MKNKEYKISIGAVVIVIIIIIGIVFFINKQGKNEDTNNEIQNNEQNEESTIKKYKIQSTKNNRIEKDEIEATNLDITKTNDQLEIVTTLKNNSSEKVQGFFIRIGILDENDKTITTVAVNSEEVIEAKGEITITNYVVGLEEDVKIKNAKIIKLEKGNIAENIDNTFDQMQEQAGSSAQ